MADEPVGPEVGGQPRSSTTRTLAVAIAGVLVGLLVAIAATTAVVAGRADAASHLPERSGEYVVVGPGDTVASLAREYAPEADPRSVIASVVALNGGERAVEVGQVLAMPVLR